MKPLILFVLLFNLCFANLYLPKEYKTILTSITGNKVNVNVKENTNIKGALLASGEFDKDNSFVDNEKLNLKTNTLSFSNLSNTQYSTNKNIGVNVNVGISNSSNPQDKQNDINSDISSIGYNSQNSLSISKSKTQATLGKGNIDIADTINSDDIKRLNTNTKNINKDLYSSSTSTNVDATLDTRLLSKDGKEEIKKEYETAKEHIQDISSAVDKVLTNKNIGITNIVEQGRDNIASTKVKDFLQDTKQGQIILQGLKSDPNSQEYKIATIQVIQKYQEFRKLDKTDVIHYDAKNTINELLKDSKAVDTQGVTIKKGDSKGTILLDVSGDKNNISNKKQDLLIAGHEIGETKYLQNGNGLVFKDSYETKEAMNDALGESFSNRISEASNEQINSTNYVAKPNQIVSNTTSNVVDNLKFLNDGLEYRQLTNSEITILNNKNNIQNFKKYYEKQTGKTLNDATAKRYLAQGGASLVDKKYEETFANNIEVLTAQEFIKDEIKEFKQLDKYISNDGKTVFTNNFNPTSKEYKNFEENIKDFANNENYYNENLKVNKQDNSSNLYYGKKVVDDTVNTVKAIYDTNGKIIVDGVKQLVTHPIDTLTNSGEELAKNNALSKAYENVGDYEKAKALKGSVVFQIGEYVAGTLGVGKTVLSKADLVNSKVNVNVKTQITKKSIQKQLDNLPNTDNYIIKVVNGNYQIARKDKTLSQKISVTKDGYLYSPNAVNVNGSKAIVKDSIKIDKENKIYNGLKLDGKLPEPEATMNYIPNTVSHLQGYMGELKLANNLAKTDRTVVSYGDKIGTHGSDVITVNTKGEVELWDNKNHSEFRQGKMSSTYTGDRLLNAKQEAFDKIRTSNLSQELKDKAIQNIKDSTFTVHTVADGNIKSSVTQIYKDNQPILKESK